MNRKIIGVYASNDIPKKKYPLPYGLIVNADPHYLPFKHWVAFYIDERGLLETFDSYGIPPSLYSPLMERFMNYFEEQLIKQRDYGAPKQECVDNIVYCIWCGAVKDILWKTSLIYSIGILKWTINLYIMLLMKDVTVVCILCLDFVKLV